MNQQPEDLTVRRGEVFTLTRPFSAAPRVPAPARRPVASSVCAWSQFPTLRTRLGHGLMAATAALFVVFLGSWRSLG